MREGGREWGNKVDRERECVKVDRNYLKYSRKCHRIRTKF